MSLAVAIAGTGVAAWLCLLLARGFFWLMRERDDRDSPPEPVAWPSVVAVVPARNEADVIAQSVSSLVTQDYPGPFHVVLVDDNSDDGTAAAAKAAAADRAERLSILAGRPLAKGLAIVVWFGVALTALAFAVGIVPVG